MMEKIRLGDAFSFIRNGANIKQGVKDGGYPITRIETISDRAVNREKMGYAGITDVSKYDDYILQDGDILMSHINSEKHLGKTAIYKKQKDEKIIHGMNLLCLRPDNSQVLPKYAFYFLSSNDFLRQIPNITKKSVNQASFTVTALKKLSFAKRGIDEQKKIVCELDKVTVLIDKRKKQLEKLDELVKSRFIELFGDCDLTAQKKEWKAVREVGTVVGGSTPKTSVAGYWNGEYRWLSPAELEQDSGVIFDSVKKITKAGIESCSLHELPVGTVILSSRAPIGKLAIAGNTFYCNQGFKNIVCSERIVPRYLYSLLLFNTEYLNSLGRGATFKEISKLIVENIKIPIPPIDLQNEFAKFVAKTDKSKFEIKQSLEKLELLKKALMQKYFG